jgi:hypothetical protein
MIDAAQYHDIALRLGHGLKVAGLVVDWPTSIRGQLHYEPVDAEALLGRLLQFGFRVTRADQPPAPSDPTPPTLPTIRLVPDDDDAA